LTSNINEIIWKLRNDSRYFKETQLSIKTKDRKIIRFKLNKPQLKIQKIVDRLKAEHKPVRLIILKSRQVGVSTNTEADIYHDTTMHPNVNSLIIAHDKESTQNLFRMSKLFWDTQDRQLRPMVKASNRTELIFENPSKAGKADDPGLRSYIRVETANNPQAGRAFTIHNLHISELAFWEKPEETMTGLMQAVPDRPQTMIVIESTANGIGNYFHRMWTDAVEGKNDFTPIFIGWHEDPTCVKEIPKDFIIYDYEHEIYGNEVELKKRFNLTDEQIYWRRYTIKNRCNNDIDKFKQEYPATPQEAFLVSGRNVFNINLIQKYYNFAREPERGELDVKDEYKSFAKKGRGELRIWEYPEKNNRYSIGVDVAEGFATGDWSCAEVFDVKNYEQVAEWHGHIKQEDFAFVLKNLAKFYNDAIIVVESNQGQVVLSYLKPIYYRLYYRKEIGKRGEKRTRELGFRTTQRSKDLLIADFKNLFEEEEIIINSKELLHELSVFVEEEPDPKKNKRHLKTGAQGKEHDDRVIAAMLSIQGLKDVPLKISKKVKQEQRYEPANPITGY